MNAKATQELAVRSSTDLAQLEELEQIILGQAEMPEVIADPLKIQSEILAQYLAAESDDDFQVIGEATPWQELLGVPVELQGFSWRPSSYEEGAPVFFVVRGHRMDDGSAVVLTTGSLNALAQLVNMAKRDAIKGAVVKLAKAQKATAGGFYPQWLEIVSSAPEAEA